MDQLPTRATLLQKIRDPADEAAWGEFVELYTPLIYGFCKRQGLQHADSADVVQDSLRAIANGIGKFEYDPERASFRAWLYTVARSKLNTHLKRSLKHPAGTGRTTVQRFIEEQAGPEDLADWELDYRRHMFQWATEKIRHEFGEAVWKAFWKTAVEEQEPQDVARDLDMKPGSVYVAKFRVIKRLREKIESVTGDLDVPPQFA